MNRYISEEDLGPTYGLDIGYKIEHIYKRENYG